VRNYRADGSVGATRRRGHLRAMALGALLAAAPALAAQADICENKAGADLIRCIEAAARTGEAGRTPDAPRTPAPPQPPATGATRPAAPVPAPAAEAPRAPAEDCTGRSGEALRRCLAAGGRLAPEAATIGPAKAPVSAPASASARADSCENKTGEALRLCIEAQAKDMPAARKSAQPQVIPCTGYTPADQPLCLHRNTALVECRNRSRYPDFDVCVRSHMARAPEPGRADCRNLTTRARNHCEARNQAYAACTGDKLGYFACLGHRLGADAVLTRR
jgi:hypothetical protein